MKNDPYPQDISQEEATLGFQRLLVEGIGDPMGSQIDIVPVAVVARILDSTDILIKAYGLDREIVYSHRRWGRDSRFTPLDHRGWCPIHPPISDAKPVIDNFKTGGVKGMFEEDIIGFPFNYEVA